MSARVAVGPLALAIGCLIGLSGCGGNASLTAARNQVKAGKLVAALVSYQRACKADPRNAAAIKAEADEQCTVVLLPRVAEDFKAGKFGEVTRQTSPMVNLPSDLGDAFKLDGLARVALATRSPVIEAGPGSLFLQGYASLNTYIATLPEEERQKELRYPGYIFHWLNQTYAQLEQAPGSPVTLKGFGEDFRQLNLTTGTGGDVGYLLRAHYYHGITQHLPGQQAEGQAPAPRQRAEALFGWLTRHLQPGLPGVAPRDARPIDVLLHGHGPDKGLAWTAIELCAHLGLPAYLRLDPQGERKEGDERPPAYRLLVSVWCGDGWLHYDPMGGVVEEAAPGPRSALLVTAEPKAYFPRSNLVQRQLASSLGVSPRLFVDADGLLVGAARTLQGVELDEATRAKSQLPLRAEGKPALAIWRYPFDLDAQFRLRDFKQAHKAANERVQGYSRPRLAQLRGEAAVALADYDKALADPGIAAGARQDCAYHRAECLEALGKAEEAIAAYRALLEAKTPWATLVRLRLGGLLIAAGKPGEAKGVLDAVEGPRAARARQLLAAGSGD